MFTKNQERFATVLCDVIKCQSCAHVQPPVQIALHIAREAANGTIEINASIKKVCKLCGVEPTREKIMEYLKKPV